MKANKAKVQVPKELNLDTLPDDELVALLGQLRQHGEEPIRAGTKAKRLVNAYTPQEIQAELLTAQINRHVGALLASARAESGLSLSAVGQEVGVSRSRINQLEKSENLEVSTLVRVAEALGYRVQISLEPTQAGRKPLKLEFGKK